MVDNSARPQKYFAAILIKNMSLFRQNINRN
jgi:hypothetical protein